MSGLEFNATKNAWRFGDIDKTRTRERSQQIAEKIRQAITEGVWRQGERLPHSSEIARRYGVHQATVQAAMSALVNEGVVRRGLSPTTTIGYFVRGVS